MKRKLWFLRWHTTNFLVWLAFVIAPRGPARSVFIEALNEASKNIAFEVFTADGPNEKIKGMARRYYEVKQKQAPRSIEEAQADTATAEDSASA